MQNGFGKSEEDGLKNMRLPNNNLRGCTKFLRKSCLPTAIACLSLLTQQSTAEHVHRARGAIVYKYIENIGLGKVIDGSAIRIVRILASDPPKGAIDDGDIALGRKVLRNVEAGQIIKFSDCFTPQQLRLAPRIDVIQGTLKMRKKAAHDREIKALFVRHRIKKGQAMELSDVTMKLIPWERLPTSQAIDIWTVYNRTALHDIEAGERLMIEDVIPIDQMVKLKESLYKS